MKKPLKGGSHEGFLDSDGEGGAQHAVVDVESNDGSNDADAGDSDRASDRPGENVVACGAEEEKREEIAGIASSTTSMGDEWRDKEDFLPV